MSRVESVVLLDHDGVASGSADKTTVHHGDTPLHLAFSCYIFDADRRLLLTQRALSKLTFPGLWTNSVCGHPLPGESIDGAVVRRAADELGITLTAPRLIMPSFQYRAEMNGVVENEMCPVLMAVVDADDAFTPDPSEVEATRWLPWQEAARTILTGELAVSPWCRSQVSALHELGDDPFGWPTGSSALLPPALR